MSRERARARYRLLLRLLPRDLREEFGKDMEQVFAGRLAEVEGDPLARAALWGAAAGDVLVHALREHTTRALRAGASWDAWAQDIRFGVRTLVHRPGFALAAISTLALGMGASVAMFSVVNGVLLRPLPFPDPERVVRVLTTNRLTGEEGTSHDHPDIRMWQDRVSGFRAVGYTSSSGTLTGFGDPEVVDGTGVSDGLITLMGFDPFMGRDLTRADDVTDGPRVLVVSHAFWTERLARDPEVLGRTLTLDGNPWEIVGVGPEGFEFPAGTSYWQPLRQDTEGCGHGCQILAAVGRVDPGTSFETVQSGLDALAANLAADYPDDHRDGGVRIVPLLDHQVAGVRTALWVLLGAVLLVLLIACGNVANLLLVRAGARADEIAVRTTLGAGRGRIVRQLLTESMIIAVAAGAIGLALATWGTALLVRMAPASIPRLQGAGLDGRVVLFAAALVVLVPALFGTLPALQSTAGGGARLGGAGTRVAGKRGARRSRSLLLAGEVALSLTLVLGAGLLIRTLGSLRTVEYGFATENVERFRIWTPDGRYDPDAGVLFQQTLEERLSALPEVTAAGMGFTAPLTGSAMGATTELLDRPDIPRADWPVLWVRPVTPGYLEATGLTLLRGRWIQAADRVETERIAVITETAARTLYPGTDPIGKQLDVQLSWSYDEDPRTIVGVVTDARYEGAMEPPASAAYVPNAQFGANIYYVTLRLANGVSSAMPAAIATLRGMDPMLAATRVTRIEEEVARDQASTRFYMTVLTLFSVLSLALAAVGLYGVVAYAVSQRTREIGIRVALGAGGGTVTAMAAREGLGPAVLGIAVGLVLARIASRVLTSLLYGVEPNDPTAALGAIGVLVAVAFAATLLPAKRASRIAPATALRTE